MEAVAIAGEMRSGTGKKAARAYRNEGKIPAVLYNKDQTVHFTTTISEVRPLIYTPDFKLANINLDGKQFKCIVKEVQYHPVTDEIIHIDFLSLVDGHPIKVQVPVRFKGNSPGVRAGGKLLQLVRRVGIKTNPENMVSEMFLDISGLQLGQSIRVRDLAAIPGIEITTPAGTPLGMIEIPRALRSAAAAEKKAADKKKK